MFFFQETAYVISQVRRTNQQKQLRNGVFYVKTSLFANSKPEPAKKWKLAQKNDIVAPFAWKPTVNINSL